MAILDKSPKRGNFEVRGVVKGNVAGSHAFMDSPATSPRSDTSARSRTRSATTVVSVSVGEVEESPTLLPPGSPELVWERALVPYSDGISSPLDLEENRGLSYWICAMHIWCGEASEFSSWRASV